MINFLHTNTPEAILISFGNLKIYWYGFFIVLSILLASVIILKLAEYYKLKKETIIDISFWLIINGLIGGRIYHIFLEFNFYFHHPTQMIKVWEGGLAIHGAIFASLLTLYYFARKNKIDFWTLASLFTPGLALGQTIGRWGNYFNQELYGKPTNVPWGIPIEIAHRLPEYYNFKFFHPTFIYESFGNLIIFSSLIFIHFLIIKKKILNPKYLVFIYLIAYSTLRFSLEFIRIDTTPFTLGLRFPQIVSIIIIIAVVFLWGKDIKTPKIIK